MQLEDTIKAMIYATIVKANQKLRELGSSKQIPGNIKVIFSNRESRVFGTAIQEYTGEMKIRFNLFNAKLNPDLVQEVISHEVSHLACFLVGHKGHDYFWSRFDRSIGGKGETHIKGVKHETYYKYSCGCRMHDISTRKHNMIKNGKAQYSCKICHKRLEFAMTPEEWNNMKNQQKEVVYA